MSEEINAFLNEIRRRTEEEINKILSEARSKAEEIKKSAEEEANRIFSHEAHSRLMLLRRKILGQAEIEGRHELIKAKNEILEKIYKRAKEMLSEIVEGKNPQVNYSDVLYNLIKEAIERMNEMEVIIEANERDMEFISKNIRRIEENLSKDLGKPIKITLSDEKANILGGVIIYSRDRRKVYYNTLEGRLVETIKKYRSILGKEFFKKYLEAK